MKKAPLLAGALLALVPVAALLPGCGGGNGGVVTPTGTAGPTPTYTSGPVPTDTTTGTPGPTGTITPTSTSVPGATATPTITPQPTSTTAPTATSTSIPTSTPVPVGAVRTNLTFTPSSDSSFAGAPLQNASLVLTTSNATNTLRFSASGAQDGNRVILSGTLPGAGQGNGYSASSSSSNSFRVRNDITANGSSTTGSFRLQSGEISITRFSQSNTAITFRNAVFSVQNDAGSARGTVTVNGTISGPYSTN